MSIRTGELAKLLGVNTDTIRRYVKKDLIPYHKTPSGHLFFTPEDVQEILGEEGIEPKRIPTWAYYTRSSSGNKTSIDNQVKELKTTYPDPTYILKDSASGLNENRKGLQRLLRLAREGQITDLAITNKDRLTRFGYTYIQELLSTHNITIHILHETENKTAEQELIQDFMNLVASFSGKFYRMRSRENQLKLLNKAVEEVER